MKIQTLKPVPWVKLSTCREKLKKAACSYGVTLCFDLSLSGSEVKSVCTGHGRKARPSATTVGAFVDTVLIFSNARALCTLWIGVLRRGDPEGP